MKNIAKLLAIVAIVALSLSLFVACDNNQTGHVCNDVCPKCGGCLTDCTDPVCANKCTGHGDTTVTHTVTVVGAIKSSTQQVKDGEAARKPADPTKAGYKFDGWFVGDAEYDWNTPVTKDITITAKFTKLFDVRSGSAVKNDDGSYTTDSGNTLITFDARFGKGTLVGKVTPGTANDCGIVFGAAQGETDNWWENNNYYTVLVNLNGTVLISHVDSGWNEIAHSPKLEGSYNPQTEYTIKVQYNEGLLVVVVNDIEVYRNSNFGELPGTIAGYRAAAAGTTFKAMEIDENQLPEVVQADEVGDFVVRNGKLALEENALVAKENNTIAVHKTTEMIDGTISVKMKAGTNGDNGIVFGLSQGDEELYWENGVSYYFFFVNIGGCAYLGKVNGGWQQCGNVPPISGYDVNKTYTLKVEVKDGTIRGYVDDVLYVTYSDESFLLGKYVGLRAQNSGTTYTDFTVSAETVEHVRPEGYDIVSGDFEKIAGQICSTSASSMMISQTATLATSGTIAAKVLSGSDSGIVFGVKSEGKAFWEGENGLSYYFFFVNKVGAPILAKIAPTYTEVKHSTLSAMYAANTVYDLKVVVKDGEAYCYVGDRLMIRSAVTLDGDGIGVRAETAGIAFRDIDVTESTQVITADALIFGHSYMQLWDTYMADLFDVNDLLNIGIGGTVATDWLNLTSEVAAYNPSKLVYMIGINDMHGNATGEGIAATVAQTLDKLHELLPSAKLVLINCNKVPLESKKAFYTQIDEFNAKLAEYAAQNSTWCTIADFASAALDGEGNVDTSLFVADNLHLNAAGYEKLTRLVRVALGLRAEGVPYKFVNGTGTYTEEKVTSTSANMLAVSKEGVFTEGTITSTIKMGTLSDSGIVFGLTDNGLENYWESGVSYYEFFITGWNGVYLAKINNGWNELKSLACGMQPGVEYTLKVEWKDGNIRCYVNDTIYIDYTDTAPLTGNKYGYRAIGTGVEYGPITTTDTVSERDVPPADYNVAAGGAKEKNGVITTTLPGTLLVHKTATMPYGTLTTTIKPVASTDNGVVFALSDGKNTSYWENESGVSYYFFFISMWGRAVLGKVNSGWTTCGDVAIDGFDASKTYTIKVEWKDGNARCYVNDVLCIDFTDTAPLAGSKYGYRAGAANVEYGTITTTDTVSQRVTAPVDYNVANGSASEADGKITSLSPNTLLFSKDGTFTEGTISATIKTVAGSDSGIVFGLDNGGKTAFWEDAEVSYYFFFINVNGDAYLAKAGGSGWQQCGNVTHITDFNAANTYTLKVVRSGNNLKCYVNDVLYVDFTDDAALSGTGYGYRAGASNVEYGTITVA